MLIQVQPHRLVRAEQDSPLAHRTVRVINVNVLARLNHTTSAIVPRHHHLGRRDNVHQNIRLPHAASRDRHKRRAEDQRVQVRGRRGNVQIIRPEHRIELRRIPPLKIQALLQSVNNSSRPPEHRVNKPHLRRQRDSKILQSLLTVVIALLLQIRPLEPRKILPQTSNISNSHLIETGHKPPPTS